MLVCPQPVKNMPPARAAWGRERECCLSGVVLALSWCICNSACGGRHIDIQAHDGELGPCGGAGWRQEEVGGAGSFRKYTVCGV